ncbi:MAG: protein translocase subunit SecDF, partial [Ginsengibacter sp.]
MKLKGLVWFFAIVLILISVYQLSFTWVVNSHESKMKAKAIKFVSQGHPGISGDEKDALVRETFHHYLDSTRDEKIYPLLGTTYQKSKENELSLGLDLQGGMSVTLNVSLDGLLKSLSNNPKDPQLLKALATANAQKITSDLDYITLFGDAFKQQNPGVNLSTIFAGAGKTVKISDNDQAVLSSLQATENNDLSESMALQRIFGASVPDFSSTKAFT